jgi:hypothetical protein
MLPNSDYETKMSRYTIFDEKCKPIFQAFGKGNRSPILTCLCCNTDPNGVVMTDLNDGFVLEVRFTRWNGSIPEVRLQRMFI